ncbi:MAG: bacteriorhodopsin-like [Bacteroidota bacterium]|jgi:bacteriorhodopsin
MELTIGQYSLVYNMLSFAIASMIFSGVFFVLARDRVAPKYRISLVVSTLVVGIAAYHYLRIFGSWEAAYVLEGGNYVASGKPFNDAYRYVDWLLTVPLLVVELLLVMGLTGAKKEGMLTNMVIAAFLMIALGYPGELITDETSMMGMRGLWGFLSTLPFVYIVYTLWNELGIAAAEKEGKTAVLYRNIRLLLLATWGFYPIVYMAPFFGWEGASTQVAIQVGYSIADVLAKAGYGVMIYAIAKAKSDDEGYAVA